MNHVGVSPSSGTRPKAWSKKCASPMTLKPSVGAASRRSRARTELSPSVRTIRSGRCSSMIRDSSAIDPRRAVSSGSSSTAPMTANGMRPSSSITSAISAAVAEGPTTRTRRFETSLWATDSQIVVSVKTARASARIVQPDIPRPGTQSARAETPTNARDGSDGAANRYAERQVDCGERASQGDEPDNREGSRGRQADPRGESRAHDRVAGSPHECGPARLGDPPSADTRGRGRRPLGGRRRESVRHAGSHV